MRFYNILFSHEEKLALEISKVLKKYGFLLSLKNPDFIVSVGGDGTYLKSYDKNLCIPILPIQNLRSLSYISDIPFKEIDKAIKKLSEEEYYIEKWTMLDVLRNGKKVDSAINDVTIFQAPFGRNYQYLYEAMRYEVNVDNKPLFGFKKLIGDGVIISTPIGSYAYNRSANGYLIPMNSKKIVVTLRYPIHLEEKKLRSIVLPDKTKIKVLFERPFKAFMTIDSNCVEIGKDETLEIVKSLNPFNLIKIKGIEETILQKELRRTKCGRKAFKEVFGV